MNTSVNVLKEICNYHFSKKEDEKATEYFKKAIDYNVNNKRLSEDELALLMIDYKGKSEILSKCLSIAYFQTIAKEFDNVFKYPF